MSSLQTGYVIHSRPYRETSLIIEFFTHFDGRVTVVAKGIKKNKALRGLVSPFQRLQVTISGSSDLKNLKNLEAAGPVVHLRQLSLYCGFYINELVLKVLSVGDASAELFNSYESAIDQLAGYSGAEQEFIEITLREFEFTLLSEMGKALEFSSESSTGKAVLPEQSYWIGFDQGISAIPVTGAIQMKGDALLAIARRDWHARALFGAKKINRYFIDQLLNAKTLHSRKMIRDYIEVMSEQSSSGG